MRISQCGHKISDTHCNLFWTICKYMLVVFSSVQMIILNVSCKNRNIFRKNILQLQTVRIKTKYKMGVKGLNHFITRFEKSVIDRIDMHEEIENWKM